MASALADCGSVRGKLEEVPPPEHRSQLSAATARTAAHVWQRFARILLGRGGGWSRLWTWAAALVDLLDYRANRGRAHSPRSRQGVDSADLPGPLEFAVCDDPTPNCDGVLTQGHKECILLSINYPPSFKYKRGWEGELSEAIPCWVLVHVCSNNVRHCVSIYDVSSLAISG